MCPNTLACTPVQLCVSYPNSSATTAVPVGPPCVNIRAVGGVTSAGGQTTVPEIYPATTTTTGIRHSFASYRQDPIPELTKNANHTESWSLCLPIAVPSDILNPTLSSLTYMLKYATKFDNGNSTIQTDAVLTTASVKSGVVKRGDDSSKGVYRSGLGYGPRLVDNSLAVALSTVSAVKCNGGSNQWSHYIDNQQLTPNIRVVQPSHVYLIFNVTEYPTEEMVRYLVVEVAASWYEDVEARKQKEAADKRAKEEAEKQAQAEAAKRAQEEAERQRKAQEELEKKIKDEVDKQVAEAEKKIKAEYEQKKQPTVASASPVADNKMQERIAEAAAKHGAACSNGYAWHKTDYGYVCGGGGHKLTWEQLGIKPN